MSPADFDFHVLITCGKNETVVRNPATNPKRVVFSIIVGSVEYPEG